jgi:glycosyltransferase involved in cell wall biosynthesis
MKRKVIIFNDGLLPFSQTFVANQIRAMRRWDPVLVGLYMKDELDLSGIRTRTLLWYNPSRLRSRLGRLAAKLAHVSKRAARSLADEKPDLVHAHFGTNIFDGARIAKEHDVPLLITLHGWDINHCHSFWRRLRKGRHYYYLDRLARLARKPFVRFVAVSNAIRERAIEVGIPAEKIVVSYIGVDTNAFRPNGASVVQRGLRVLFVGRLAEKKGADVLVRAMRLVQERLPEAELVIVGDGEQRNRIKSLAMDLNVRVLYAGAVPNNHVKYYLETARVLCLPSITTQYGDAEGLGLVLLEAQAAGVPVVTSARGGSSEAIIEGKTGFRFREGDCETLAELLGRLLRDDELCQAMSVAGPSFVKGKFDIESCTANLELIYDACVSDYAGRIGRADAR